MLMGMGLEIRIHQMVLSMEVIVMTIVTMSMKMSNEICDELDNDCDEDIDEEPIDGNIFYEDQDDDGFGSNNVSLSKMCSIENGYVR